MPGVSKIRMVTKDIWMGPLDQNTSNQIRPGDAKIAQGWEYGEKPAHTAFNWSWNVIMQNMVHIMENGLPKWDKDTTYGKDSLTLSNGTIWKSKADGNQGNLPPTNTPDNYWTFATPLTAATTLEAESGDARYDNKYINPRVLKSLDLISKTEVIQMINAAKANYWTASRTKQYVDDYKPHILRCTKV